MSAQIKAGDFKGKPSEVAVFYAVPGLDFKRVIAVGLGMKDAFSEKTFINVHRKVARFVKCGSVALTSAEWTLPERDEAWAARSAVRELLFASTSLAVSRPKERARRSWKRFFGCPKRT